MYEKGRWIGKFNATYTRKKTGGGCFKGGHWGSSLLFLWMDGWLDDVRSLSLRLVESFGVYCLCSSARLSLA